MEIPINAQVVCADGVCGKSIYVLINPLTDLITHLVVKFDNAQQSEVIVPAGFITETTHHTIHMKCSKADLKKMDEFNKIEYVEEKIPAGYTGYSDPYGIGTRYLWPYVSAERTIRVPVENPQIPSGEMAIRRGAKVRSIEGNIGQIDELMVDPQNEHITHIVMRRGHLWGQKDVIIPVSAIKEAHRDLVELNIDKHQVEALPSIKIDRNWNEN